MKKNIPYIFIIFLISLMTYQAKAVIKIESHQNVSAFGVNDGSIDITATGTAGPFTFNWSHGQTTEDVSGLSPGFYTVTVTNAYRCETTLTQYIALPMTMQTDLTYTRGCGSGTITLNMFGGYAPYTVIWSDNVGMQSNSTTITRSNLSAGTYSATVTDYSGQSVTITRPYVVTAPSYSLNLTGVTQSACNGPTGAIDITVNSGHYPYTYDWSPGGSTQDLQNIAGGTYRVTVTDANGCQGVESFDIPNSNIVVNPTIQSACVQLNDGFAHVYATGGNAPYSYSWTFNGYSMGNTQLIEDLPPNRTFTVDVVDAAGCQVTENYTIPEEPEITAIDAENCVYVTKCRAYEDPQGSPQWNPSTYENFDKDNCEMTVYCPLTQQNETYTGKITSEFKFTLARNEDCLLPSDRFCQEQKWCEIYKPSDDENISKKMSSSGEITHIFPSSTGMIPYYWIDPNTGQYILRPTCSSGTSLVEVWCGPQRGDGKNFLDEKCFRCSALPWLSVNAILDPDFCEINPCICDPCLCDPCICDPFWCDPAAMVAPVITNVTPNPFYEYFGIQFESPTEETDIRVYDAIGRKVYEEALEPQIGENTAIVRLADDLPQGMYFVTLQSSNGLSTTYRLVRQKGY